MKTKQSDNFMPTLRMTGMTPMRPGLLQRAAVNSAAPAHAVPSVVHDVLRAPGQPLDAATRVFMEPRFGHDFSSVRVHTDDRAAESARAVNALAYTVGRNVVFDAGQYQPRTSPGQRLLAHELTHVLQQQGNQERPVRIGEPDDALEREARRHSERATYGSPPASGTPFQVSDAPPTLQRTLMGGIVGGLLGAAGGIALGALVGGAIGAVIGGVVGAIGGAVLGDMSGTRSRHLTNPEVQMAREIFQESIDYKAITITRDSLASLGAPRTLGNTIHLKSDWGLFQGDTLELSPQGQETLIHEMTHVWQYQNGGLAYIPESLIAQLRAKLVSGSRDAAYDWRASHDAGLPWERWNPEQQAAAVEDYNRLLRLTRSGGATAEDYRTMAILLPYIERVRHREGAPGSKARPAASGSAPADTGSAPAGAGGTT